MGNTLSTDRPDVVGLVEEGRQLAASLSENKWGLGDVAQRFEPIGARGGSPAQPRLREFADQIGVSYNSLREYRAVAAAWPNDRRLSSVPYAIHQALRGREDRFEIIGSRDRWTVREARELVAESRRGEGRPGRRPGAVGLPGDDDEPFSAVTWASVAVILEEELREHEEIHERVRERLLPLFEGAA